MENENSDTVIASPLQKLVRCTGIFWAIIVGAVMFIVVGILVCVGLQIWLGPTGFGVLLGVSLLICCAGLAKEMCN